VFTAASQALLEFKEIVGRRGLRRGASVVKEFI